jgi:hypothetical protein
MEIRELASLGGKHTVSAFAEEVYLKTWVDATTASVHDHLRGSPGPFEKLRNGIVYLLEERKRQQVEFPITLKPTINSVNFRFLPALVGRTSAIGDLCVSPHTMSRWTSETYDELWI